MFSFAVVKTDDEIKQRGNSGADQFQYLREYLIPTIFVRLNRIPSG